MRKGQAKGQGKGYKNLRNFPKDPKVHSMSAKGMKQPQRINIPREIVKRLDKKQTWKEFDNSDFRLEINRYSNDVSDFTFNNDFFARWWFQAFPYNRDERYMHQWVDRFRKGTPTVFMDKERREAYFKVAEEW